jgi:hypothetical protein
MHGRDDKCVQNFGRKPEGKRSLGRSRHRWEGKIRMDLRKIGWEGVVWIHLAQDRDQWWDLVSMVMKLYNLYFPSSNRSDQVKDEMGGKGSMHVGDVL